MNEIEHDHMLTVEVIRLLPEFYFNLDYIQQNGNCKEQSWARGNRDLLAKMWPALKMAHLLARDIGKRERPSDDDSFNCTEVK